MTQAAIALPSLNISLYEQDYLLWIEDVVNKLRIRNTNELDFENLIEEIEDLGRSQRRELESRLRELFEHILKRIYVDMPECDRGWVVSIIKQRIALKQLIQQSPSLKSYFPKVFDEAYRDTLKILRHGYPEYQFPEVFPFSRDIDSMLNVDFWEL